MSYQTPMTIATAVRKIQDRHFVLPDIQREFVWQRDQIEELFDSLMRGYPIGSFLFWELPSDKATDFRFYEFVTDFDVREPHNEQANLMPNTPVTSVLDGQQRLTALNIALRGSYREKLPRKSANDPNAYPKRHLHLNVLTVTEDAAPDEAMYEFSFLTEAEAEVRDGSTFWVPVSAVLQFDPNELDHEDYLEKHGLDDNKIARKVLFRLTKLIHTDQVIAAYLEEEHDLDKVLNIFIRVNRGGTKLSYSDLLMSVATAKWEHRDAREEVHNLVDDLNSTGEGFDFSRDRVLKASLVISDLPDIKLKAKNMLDNMLEVERRWDDIRNAMVISVRLLADFGFSATSLRAENAVIPIAYYVHHRQLDDKYLGTPKHRADRELVRSWVVRSILRAGFWTGAVDPILIESRKAIKEHGSRGFPLDEIEQRIAAAGKSLEFTAPEIEDLLLTGYKRPTTIPLLTLLFPASVERHAFHVDHVYPRAKLRRRNLKSALSSAGRSPEDLELWLSRVDQVANLQLLRAEENVAKGDLTPATWSSDHLQENVRNVILPANDLGTLPQNAVEWFDWFESRHTRMAEALTKLLATR